MEDVKFTPIAKELFSRQDFKAGMLVGLDYMETYLDGFIAELLSDTELRTPNEHVHGTLVALKRVLPEVSAGCRDLIEDMLKAHNEGKAT